MSQGGIFIGKFLSGPVNKFQFPEPAGKYKQIPISLPGGRPANRDKLQYIYKRRFSQRYLRGKLTRLSGIFLHTDKVKMINNVHKRRSSSSQREVNCFTIQNIPQVWIGRLRERKRHNIPLAPSTRTGTRRPLQEISLTDNANLLNVDITNGVKIEDPRCNSLELDSDEFISPRPEPEVALGFNGDRDAWQSFQVQSLLPLI
jgi:hypothetical protein